ncbi:MAG: hypothetical protein A2538_04740 [Candidatus Magasanikbacteria bacterium RIFOXYD2_FULL_41_14]|uniref:NAD-dependent epimerase/dehydratase domain-containing protein n=1 Tax=Candidatus Magasanikbacteria bacterium RIFOXYD2_FULL_41_14 TaxID=1798709 RepID=A0A1F6PFM4_9BACT|nr:MAG: hypothetical protein A2538_04740 [Candidatus Magasanikbacteria bacterium RIFOXYD2_FULL_41_14]
MVNFSKKKILITGGAGFIGKHLIQRLQQQDVRSIRVTSRNLESDSFLNNLGLDIKVGDLKDPIFCDQITEGIDVVFHLAGQKHNYFVHSAQPANILYENNLINGNILESARHSNVSCLVMASSIVVYRGGNIKTYDEDSETILSREAPHLGYAWSKRILEILSYYYRTQYHIDIRVCRLGSAYGPFDKFNSEFAQIVPSLINKIYHGDVIEIDSRSTIKNLIYVGDIADALIKTLFVNKWFNVPVNIVDPKSRITYGNLVDMLGNILNIKPIVKEIGTVGLEKYFRSKYNFYTPRVSLDEGLRATVDYYLKHVATK